MGDQSFVSQETRQRIKGAATPIALALGRLGLTPNALTVIGFGITVVAAALAATQNWLLAGLVVLFGGVFDMFDGTLARATGTTSKLGAFMDSTFDRWGEGVVYVGIIAGCAASDFQVGVILAGVAMSSAFLVSYARARAESLGFHGEVGVAPRAERLVVVVLGLVLTGLSGGPGPTTPSISAGSLWLGAAMGLIGLLATITVIQRILHVRSQARASAGSTSQSSTPPTR